MTTRECIDEYARDEVRQQRADHAELRGVVLRMDANVTLLVEALRARANGTRRPSFAELVDEATNPDLRRPSDPVKVAIQRGAGVIALWVVGAIIAGWLGNEGVHRLMGH